MTRGKKKEDAFANLYVAGKKKDLKSVRGKRDYQGGSKEGVASQKASPIRRNGEKSSGTL